MKLHYNPFSPNSRKVALLIAHIQAPVELVTVNLAAGEAETPAFLAMNPNGLIPVLEDVGYSIWESNAIMQYLAEKTGAESVWPKDLKTRSQIAQWQFWETNHFGRAAMVIGFERFMKKILMGEGPNPETVNTYLELFRLHGKVLNHHLSSSPFIVGRNPTLADFALGGSMQFAHRAELPFKEFPQIDQWFGRLQALEAWKATEYKRS